MNAFLPKIGLLMKERRKQLGLTQIELAERSGVGLPLIRALEQGKPGGYRLDKVNQLLNFLGHELGAVPLQQHPSEV